MQLTFSSLRFRSYLREVDALAPKELAAARHWQEVYGGSLDTALLELGLCSPAALCRLLHGACGLDVVEPELLRFRSRPWDVLPPELQDSQRVVPLARIGARTAIGVHPDVSNEALGYLCRSVPGALPLVSPECALAKVAAEKRCDAIPVRYEKLYAALVDGLKSAREGTKTPPLRSETPTDGRSAQLEALGRPCEDEVRRLSALCRDDELCELRALGDDGMRMLARNLPGPLELLRGDARVLPRPSAHGPFIRAAVALGVPFTPHAVALFADADAEKRFYAAFIFRELRDDAVVGPMSRLAFDENRDVRTVAMQVLETYRRAEGFEDGVAYVRSRLDDADMDSRILATKAVGVLRDVHAVSRLIAFLSSEVAELRAAALASLCSITGQQHGAKPRRWGAWYVENGAKDRVEWIIDSFRHPDAGVRRWAHAELIRVTGHRVPFCPLGGRSAREVAHQAWTAWWHGQRTQVA